MRYVLRFVIPVVLLFPAAAFAQDRMVTCASDDGDKHYCEADTRHGARLVQQTSKEPCTEGTTWGWDEEGIWVDKGCAGKFALGGGDAIEPPAEPGRALTLVCASEGGRRKYCPAETSGHVQLVKQDSGAPCTQGSTWGFDLHGVWVNQGCAGEFVVGLAEHPAAAQDQTRSTTARVTCRSDGGPLYCDADTRGAQVTLAKRLGPMPCEAGQTWGYDQRGIWVDRGCQAEFLVRKLSAADLSCLETAGRKKAQELVDRCREVSPATHPPCNAQNSCTIIEDEIRRGCKSIGANAPNYCAEYKN